MLAHRQLRPEERPDLAAVLEQEEQDDEGQHDPGGHLRDGRRPGDGPGLDGGALQHRLQLAGDVLDVDRGQPEGTGLDETL